MPQNCVADINRAPKGKQTPGWPQCPISNALEHLPYSAKVKLCKISNLLLKIVKKIRKNGS